MLHLDAFKRNLGCSWIGSIPMFEGRLLDVIRARACSITVSSPLPGSHHPMLEGDGRPSGQPEPDKGINQERKKKSHS